MTAEEEGMTVGMITEVHDQREGAEVLVRKDRIADPVRITAARDLRVVIADPVRKADRIADHDLRGRTTPHDQRVEIRAI